MDRHTGSFRFRAQSAIAQTQRTCEIRRARSPGSKNFASPLFSQPWPSVSCRLARGWRGTLAHLSPPISCFAELVASDCSKRCLMPDHGGQFHACQAVAPALQIVSPSASNPPIHWLFEQSVDGRSRVLASCTGLQEVSPLSCSRAHAFWESWPVACAVCPDEPV